MSSAKEQARVQEDAAEDAKICQELGDLDRVLEDQTFHTEKVVEYNAKQFVSLAEGINACRLMDMDGNLQPVMLRSCGTQDVYFFTPLDFAFWSAAGPDHAELPLRLTRFPYLLDAKINMYILPRLARDRSDRPIDSLLKVDTKPAKFPAANLNKVICFGFGELDGSESEDGPDSLRRDDRGLEKYLILLAFELVHWLELKLHIKVPMIFEDSRCDQQDRRRVEDFAEETVTRISFMNNRQALLEVDKDTLVLAAGKSRFAIRSPIADITKHKGGPAGNPLRNSPGDYNY
ncbi:hypothetical protein BKA58DRAFT_399426 [Alternaria rosae]|uniref:uncharacterized protein n=1 Tax=Alternaria rosae TaxID=1187941 RepID=UPI001E8CF401|nr:uncharacterized protein BKA58DRAFT_399426 [Alternaria rosae]KAH6875201.1 hypothetical protein BKA58DRAFT_399426 [Alternaria rosae]